MDACSNGHSMDACLRPYRVCTSFGRCERSGDRRAQAREHGILVGRTERGVTVACKRLASYSLRALAKARCTLALLEAMSPYPRD